MGRRLLPHTLPELYAHALSVEREAMERYAELEQLMRDTGQDHLAEEFEKLGGEEREQYEALVIGTAGRDLPKPRDWERPGHFLGAIAVPLPAPTSTREAIAYALAGERTVQCFYTDIAENAVNDAVRAFAAERAADEQRHVAHLEILLAREPESRRAEPDEAALA